ncbi:DUF1998 domain-containing protein [Frankia sp. Ag45/Mut15]|uniref:DUF1998 domain-containing protein n=1 Tax=Frankia umida TaxID=573489 RepID=A0ABT0JYZ2_9ACTN|nr:DUF1998 domain-containing protein [Frankia umida]MCK9876758.1 DUF1998 domain-containing protein [Frankia umida]
MTTPDPGTPPAGAPAATPMDAPTMLLASSGPLDPLGDAEDAQVKNRAKVGSARPSALLYTFGVGSIMDLPQFSIMPAGLEDWEPIWRRRQFVPQIDEPRLLDAIRILLPKVRQLRPFPWQPVPHARSADGSDLGIPARVFPQWMRCTGCDFLGPLARFEYTNTHPFRPDLACFEHVGCPGRRRQTDNQPSAAGKGKAPKKRQRRSPAVPARYLLACHDGHLDEFPYALWVHRGNDCPKGAEAPQLKLIDTNIGQGASAIMRCEACQTTRGMGEARGDSGQRKLPTCRGRHPHLNAFDRNCENQTKLIMMGASNLWFSATQSVIVMPRTTSEQRTILADTLRTACSAEEITAVATLPGILRTMLDRRTDLTGVSDEDLLAAAVQALAPPPDEEEREERLRTWDPVDLLVPEWEYLQKPSLFARQENASGLMVTEQPTGDRLPAPISRVIAVNRMKKINAMIGFTRIDELDRVADVSGRLVKLSTRPPTWVPATEDRGEGVFLQLDEPAVAAWEAQVLQTSVWKAHQQAHERNFTRRFSVTAALVDPATRLPAPRYWLVHTLAHLLIREMAMACGYGAASLSERLYAWPATDTRPAAAGLLIATTAADSEGTLGGLVALSEPERLQSLVVSALRRASRCSSDPVCAGRVPRDPEDFLHGAACHCCCFASETSCEKANRFLDRRFLLRLPTSNGETVPAFFGTTDAV